MIHEEVATVGDVNAAIAKQIYPEDRRAPTTLDGLADMLREYGVRRVIATFWSLTPRDTQRVEAVFDDLGVELIR